MIRTEQMEFVNRTGLFSMTPECLHDEALTVRGGRTTFATVSRVDTTRGRVASCDSDDVFHSRARVEIEFITFGGRF
jgi:hypothetical protein